MIILAVMNVLSTNGWQDYELLDSGDGKRLERFGKFVIVKPDPQAIWKPNLSNSEWEKADAVYNDENKSWNKNGLPEKWLLNYKDLNFYAKLTPFKHTGVFPEQALNWEFIESRLQNKTGANVLNLFGYTGIASLVSAANGASVVHVDGSKPSIGWARENQDASNLSDKPIRWILDDALEFTAREARRGNVYDAVIMDPPVYGHGPKGETWDFSKDFPALLENLQKILAKEPLFVIINAYAVTASSIMLKNMMEDYLNLESARTEYGELALEEKSRDRLLSTGIFARY